jgi:hypothetical protein
MILSMSLSLALSPTNVANVNDPFDIYAQASIPIDIYDCRVD